MDRPIQDQGQRGAIFRSQLGARVDLQALIDNAPTFEGRWRKVVPLIRVDNQMDGFDGQPEDWTLYLRRTGLWFNDNADGNEPLVDQTQVVLQWGDGPSARTTRVDVSFPGICIHVSGGNFRAWVELDFDRSFDVTNYNEDDILEATLTPGRPTEARSRRTAVIQKPAGAGAITLAGLVVPDFANGLRVYGHNVSQGTPIDMAAAGAVVYWYNQAPFAASLVTTVTGTPLIYGYGTDGFMPPGSPAKFAQISLAVPVAVPTVFEVSWEWRYFQ